MRGVAVVLVLLGHAAALPVAYADRVDMEWIRDLNGVIEPYRIPSLLVLSGLLLPQSLSKPLGTFYWGKIRHIAWPYLVWMCMFALVPGISYLLVYPQFWLGDYGNSLWFLVVLFFCYLTAPVIHLLRIPWWVLAVVSWMACFAFAPLEPVWERQLWWSGFFYAGAAFRPRLETWQERPAQVGGLLGAGALGWALWVAVGEQPVSLTPLAVLGSLIGVALLIWLTPRIESWTPMRWAAHFGRRSIVVYVAHYPFMFALMPTVAGWGASAAVTFAVLSVATLVFIVVLLAVEPHVRFLFVLPNPGRVTPAGHRQ